jgi:hypothetical protein
MDNHDAHEALDVLAKVHPPRLPLLVLAFAILALSVGALTLSHYAHANREAIRVSCQLLANAIAQSGVAASGPDGHRPPQQQLTALYISVVHRAMTPADRRQERRLLGRVAAIGTPLSIPNCGQIARHPESVAVTPNR